MTIDLEALYIDLHEHPELSFQETRTAAIAAGHLRDLGLEVTEGVGGTGVVGVLRNGDGPTVWLRADIKIIAARVQRRDTRPLLRGKDATQALTAMAEVRYPVYSQADVTVDVGAGAHAEAVEAIVKALESWRADAGVGQGGQ